MQLFYNATLNPNDTEIAFDNIESKHLAKVLRKKISDPINITNGKGYLFEAKLSMVTDKKCIAKIENTHFFEKQKPTITLAIAPTKSIDRIEWLLEKATEIGLDTFVPLLCQHSERKQLKTERLEKIAISAIKQSQQYWLPIIEPLTNFKKFVTTAKGTKLIAHCDDDSEKKLISEFKNAHDNYSILIGPEGDFSVNEIKLATDNGFNPISLGNNRLRTETAGLVAVSCLNI